MTIQPVHHWQFDEQAGSITTDRVNGVEGRFHRTAMQLHGRIGDAVLVRGKDGRIIFGDDVGQFGTSDFTITFGMSILSTHNQNNLDILSNRNVKGHGNWFAVRLRDKQRITFEVDENSKAKHYALARTGKVLRARNWYHIAVVRQGRTIKIYIDGVLQAEAASDTGIANIKNGVDLRLGHYREETPTARYEDLRIYDTALSSAEINNLFPPEKRVLRAGEVELVAADGAAVVLTKDESNLVRLSPQFKRLRLGSGTGVTLYKDADFGGVAQKLYADIPDARFTKLTAFPKSIHIWSAAGEPFTGKWIIKAPNGQYLSRRGMTLTTAPHRLLDELFVFVYNPTYDQVQLIPVTDQEGLLLRVAGEHAALLVDDREVHKDAFALINPVRDEWLTLTGNTFGWTSAREERAVFFRAAKLATNEGQVGDLAQGEVALYEHIAYKGQTWILSDTEGDVAGNFTSLSSFHRLDNTISSIRLGPNTGVTLFANANQSIREDKRETDIEDFVESVPDLREAQIGNDTISSLKVFRTVAPEALFTSVTAKLSQDYRMVEDELEEFSSYRTILRLTPEVNEIEVSATDLTTIEVEGDLHEIDEVRSVVLRPNLLRQIMITSEADGISTPGLKFRTSDMPENERVVIFPDQEVHQQIAELEDDALWNATDAEGNLIIDQSKHTRSEVASVQSTIKRTMASVVTTDESDDAGTATVSRSASPRVASTKQVVAAANVGDPWTINFTAPPANRGNTRVGPGRSAIVLSDNIWEEPLTQDAFEQRLKQVGADGAARANASAKALSSVASLRIGSFFSDIGDAIKDAVSVTIGAFNGALNAIIDIGGRIVNFVLDTAKKVADFVTAIIEKVVESIKQFIEFLRFLFNWDDILETQRFMVRTINSAFDSAGALVASAKEPVSDFINEAQDALEDGINSLIRGLGVDPSDDNASGVELPEAAEWFFNKLLGGSKRSDSRTDPKETADIDGSTGSALEQALASILDALVELAEIGFEIFEGLVETVATLITNPSRPELALVEILEMIRDVGVQALEFGESVVHAFLDTVVAAIQILKDMLNAKIRIPLISDLFELLGAGDLTILNVTTVLLAIPVTVVSKLMFGEAPFQEATPDFPKQAAIVSSNGQHSLAIVAEANTTSLNVENTRRKMISFGVIAIVADLINGLIATGMDLVPEDPAADEGSTFLETMSLILSGFSWLASFPSSPVEPGGYPYNLLAPENRVSKSQNEQEYWERVMWGWRTGMLGFDIVFTMAAPFFDKLDDQRLRRSNAITSALLALFTAVNIGLTGRFLGTIPKEDDRAREIANEVLGLLPDLFGWLRQDQNPTTQFASLSGLFTINVIATVSTTIFGVKFLRRDVEALREL